MQFVESFVDSRGVSECIRPREKDPPLVTRKKEAAGTFGQFLLLNVRLLSFQPLRKGVGDRIQFDIVFEQCFQTGEDPGKSALRI